MTNTRNDILIKSGYFENFENYGNCLKLKMLYFCKFQDHFQNSLNIFFTLNVQEQFFFKKISKNEIRFCVKSYQTNSFLE